MAAAARCLHDNGLFLCHTIGGNVSRVRTDPWIDRYIFPDSMLPSPAQVARAAEDLNRLAENLQRIMSKFTLAGKPCNLPRVSRVDIESPEYASSGI